MVRSAILWLCRTPQRLATAVVVLLAVVLLGGGALFGGPLGGGAGGGRDARATPAPTSAQVPDAAPYVSAAVRFVGLWAKPAAGETAEQWRTALAPLATAEFAKSLGTTDLGTLPGVGVQGEPVVRFLAQSSALVAVPLADGSSVLVSAVADGDATRVSDVQPNVGDD